MHHPGQEGIKYLREKGGKILKGRPRKKSYRGQEGKLLNREVPSGLGRGGEEGHVK